MSDKETNEPAESSSATLKSEPRLCSEIQLFDLCELSSCGKKEGRFCTDSGLLARFEKIAEKDEAAQVHPSGDEEDDGEDCFSEEFDPGDDEGDDWEE